MTFRLTPDAINDELEAAVFAAVSSVRDRYTGRATLSCWTSRQIVGDFVCELRRTIVKLRTLAYKQEVEGLYLFLDRLTSTKRWHDFAILANMDAFYCYRYFPDPTKLSWSSNSERVKQILREAWRQLCVVSTGQTDAKEQVIDEAGDAMYRLELMVKDMNNLGREATRISTAVGQLEAVT